MTAPRGEPTASTDAAHEDTVDVREPMARLRPDEPAGMALARARVLGALFGEHSAAGRFGRFRVLDRLGAGGMGVVYEAYDPELARGVALKLVNVTARGRDAALAEAKALARLSHPNVVPIYDVGVEGEHVYLVMELVRGQTLRDWPDGRTVREVVDVYHQAGMALVAAHAAGLVHRDFKPENAIVGADGRVRVVDFGLACEVEDPAQPSGPRRPAGTPRFVAPEILVGAAVTPAADQFSFCIALDDGLRVAREPVPRRIAAVLERGRAETPAERFPSMAELLRALARDPARTRRRIGAAGGLAVVVGAAAFLVGRTAREAEACDSGAALLDAAWSPAARAQALGRLATLGPYGASLRPQIERPLDEHARRWVSQDRAACVDRRRGAQSSALSDRRTACLRRSVDALGAVGDLIAGADASHLAELPRAVQSMPDPAACSNLAALLADVAPPPPEQAAAVARAQARVTEARILVGAGRYDRALADAGRAADDASRLDYPPVLAEALLVQGHARMYLPDRGAAVPILSRALTLAVASGDDALEIEAWARRAWARGTSRDPGGALDGLDLIEPLAKRTPAPFVRALLYNNLGSVELGADRRAEARAHFDRALAESQQVNGPHALELLAIRVNAALATDDRGRADRLLADAATELAARLGPDHPDALEARRLRGFRTLDGLREAEQLLAAVCTGYELHPALSEEIGTCWYEVGFVRWDLGDRPGALEAMQRAARTPGYTPDAAAYVLLFQGDAALAAQRFADALAAAPPSPEDPWWDRAARAGLSLGLGSARRALGDLAGAHAALESAVADLELVLRESSPARFERRLGRARVELALTLAAQGAAPPKLEAAAIAAAAWLRKGGGADAEIAAIDALTHAPVAPGMTGAR